ncbi:cyclopropane-fatty-acyl-phospholipid synthase family protein [Mumia sp. zg.B17]|uniref:SAM-dependent methyltransferase n=1 Tax=unclassified Mumia TaxID=2621872 RepID=UPI001C6F52CC|nr:MULTISPECIES: cyclopropane-fatty-acyl-phospholipid synthase family protein [unclassified Mumia]MBW9207268.1 cyclopropane-fatty-acyl-phospholipid synthase family protein [Mumia sp. zg.B17]MDD9348999.1 cyclopropane-fatty-acyl-phospholipid synthase [Mumia sp.]
MTTLAKSSITLGEAVERLVPGELSFRFEGYDDSSAGPADAPITVRIVNERGLSYIMSAPGDLGFARAYVSGDLELDGVHPGDPYDALVHLQNKTRLRAPSAAETFRVVKALGLSHLVPPPAPPQEHLPRWRRAVEGLRHTKSRDAAAIHHHYDVSNRFYELVLGPSMTYTCAVFPKPDSTLEEAQFEKYDLVCRKLDLRPGQRLLDIGCGWGGMVRHAAKHYGVKVIGATLSEQQAIWAQQAIAREGLSDLAEVRFSDYRDVPEGGFDAISSIGLTEHIGVHNYASYFGFIRDHLKVGGRMLNHCITRPDNRTRATAGQFIDRYVFPDGELTGSGRIITEVQDAGLEVQHEENLRLHYAMTLREWNHNLRDNWDEAVAEVGVATAKVWGLYMAGSRLGFDRNSIQLHHVLATKTSPTGQIDFPLRPTWGS